MRGGEAKRGKPEKLKTIKTTKKSKVEGETRMKSSTVTKKGRGHRGELDLVLIRLMRVN